MMVVILSLMSGLSILSFNVRGLNRAAKRRWLGNFLGDVKPSCVFLVETKLIACNSRMVNQIWKMGVCNWSCSPSDGASGGILVIWDPAMFDFNTVLIQPRFILLSGFCPSLNLPLSIAGVYAPNVEAERILFLQDLRNATEGIDDYLIICGDFNATLSESERVGIASYYQPCQEFISFCNSLGLVDIPLSGKRFTWVGNRGRSQCRID